MFGSAVDTAIGVVLVFLLFSLLISILMEIFSGLLGLRARALENAIARLVEDPAKFSLLANVLGAFGAHVVAIADQRRTYASAVAKNLKPAGPPPSPLSYKTVYQHPLIAGTSGTDRPSYVPGANFASALVQVLGALKTGGAAFANVQAAVDDLPQGDLKTALQTLIAQAGGDLAALRKGIETWFDSAMDRLSGEYKRFTQVVTFVAALILAVAFNVDAVNVGQRLYAEPALRASLVAAAEAQVKAGPPAAPGAGLDSQIKALGDAQAKIAGLGPVGWTSDAPAEGWSLAALGWLITALAALMGAPFWFDTLKGLVNLRAVGPKPLSTTSGTGK